MSETRIKGYAKAIFQLAAAEDVTERTEGELFSLAQALERSTDLRSALTDPQLPAQKKEEVIEDLIGGRASSLTMGIVDLIVSQGHASDLPAIARAVAEIAASERDRAYAEVRSAVSLDEATVSRLEAALAKATGKQVEVKVVVDPALIGGLVARVGDTVIDGSIARRVDSVRQVVESRQ